MPFTRKSVKYNSAGLFLTDSPSNVGQEIEQLHFFNRVQSAGLQIGVNRQNIKQLGSTEFIDRKIVTEFDVSFNFDYLLTDGTEEYVLGLGVASGVFNPDAEGVEPNIPCLRNSESNPISPNLYQGLKDNKNAFLIIGAEEFDLTGYINRDHGFSGVDCISVANCYLTSYGISAAVGSVATASVQMKASNVKYTALEATTIGDLAALLLEIDIAETDFVRLEEGGGKIMLGSDLEGEAEGHLNGHTFGSLDLVQSGSGITGTLFSFDPEIYQSAAGAISPGGIHAYLEDLTMGGPVLGQNNTGMYHHGMGNVQSVDISVPFDREDLMGFSSMNAYGRKMKYPQLGTVNVSLLQDAFVSGELQDMLCNDNEYSMNIYLNNNCAYTCATAASKDTYMQFQVSNLKLEGYSLANSIGSRGTVDCSFSFEMSPERGLKIRSSAPNPKLPCGEFPPKEPQEAPPFIGIWMETYSDAVNAGRATGGKAPKPWPANWDFGGTTDQYFEQGDTIRVYLSYDFNDFPCHKAGIFFEIMDPYSDIITNWATEGGRSINDSLVEILPEQAFSSEWIPGLPDFDDDKNYTGYKTEGTFQGIFDGSAHDIAGISTLYLDLPIGANSGMLPIYFKTRNFEGDYSYHVSVPLADFGIIFEQYEPPYTALVIN